MNSGTEDQAQFSLELLRKGDRDEFSRLVEAYSGLIYRLALRMLENQQDAEDVLQETYLKAFRSLNKFDGRSSLATWLYRIATNEALMTLRRKRSRGENQNVLSLDTPVDDEEELSTPVQIVDWCCLPEVELMSGEARAYLDRAIETLPPTLRIVFILRDLDGLSTAETGEVLNLSETAVKTRLSRARLRLREKLSEYFGPVVQDKNSETEDRFIVDGNRRE